MRYFIEKQRQPRWQPHGTVFCAFVVFGAVLSGCGGGGSTPQPSSPLTPPLTPAPIETPAPITPTTTPTPSPSATPEIPTPTPEIPTPTPIPPPAVSVTLNPATAEVLPGSSLTLTAIVANSENKAATWTVQEEAGGTVTPDGLYTAPLQAGVYHVVATSQADPAQSAAATITVPIVVQVTPAVRTLSVGDTAVFTTNVIGTSETGVTWRVEEGERGGTITDAGVYRAPRERGIYHVIATSKADSTRIGAAVVTVQSGSTSGVIE